MAASRTGGERDFGCTHWLVLAWNSCSPAAGYPAEGSAKPLKGQNCGMSVSIATSQWATFAEQFPSSGPSRGVSSGDGYVSWGLLLGLRNGGGGRCIFEFLHNPDGEKGGEHLFSSWLAVSDWMSGDRGWVRRSTELKMAQKAPTEIRKAKSNRHHVFLRICHRKW